MAAVGERGHVLLSDDAPNVPGMPDWRMWLRAAGIRDLDPSSGYAYSDSAMMVQAAVEGQAASALPLPYVIPGTGS